MTPLLAQMGPSLAGMLCFLVAAMIFFAGSIGVIVLLCTRLGRRALTICALFVVVAFVAVGVLRFHGAFRHATAQRAAAEADQRTVADRIRAEIEARLGGDALQQTAGPRPDHVTLEIRWHADKLPELRANPGAIVSAVTSILTAVDDTTNEETDLADVPLTHLLDLRISLDDDHKFPLGEVAQVGRRRQVGVARPEDTIHLRIEGLDASQAKKLMHDATALLERAVAAADDPLRTLVNIDRDEDSQGFALRIPAREVRQVAARLMLPVGLDTPVQQEGKATKSESVAEPADELAAAEPVAAEKPLSPEPATPQPPPRPVQPQLVATPSVARDTSSGQRAKPAWVANGKEEERLPNGVYRIAARSGPYSSTEECFAEAPTLVRGIVHRYVARLYGNRAAEEMQVPGIWIESALVKDQWIGEVESVTLGTTMYEMHVLVEFDDMARRELAGMWHQTQLERRLTMTGAASGLVLLLLGTTFGYLKLDTATRGFYSGRLKLAAGAIVAGAGLALFQMLRMV
ncbi:MAG: hypothetical protein KF708_10655 [Pirellulales bacterium]|nr:hypothetical protein [Pirellulales bacterium]